MDGAVDRETYWTCHYCFTMHFIGIPVCIHFLEDTSVGHDEDVLHYYPGEREER